MPITQIASEDLIPIEQHYRIAAGPGAGKTYWLVSHIRNVLQTSKRLGCYKKIACITYTNVAVDTIIRRLDFVADRVEVCTIHSFIYNNIIKPYMSFIAMEYDFNVHKMDGHDDHFISRSKISDWITSHRNLASFSVPYNVNQMTRIDHNLEAIGKWLSSISYEIDSAGEAKITVDNSKANYTENGTRKNLGKATCLDKLFPGLIDYKKIFWKKGILHHDDVLFFGYTLLKKFPFIVTILQAKFPYFFVDEFQDTSPIQSEILNILGQKETIIGIIGDKAQSIYSFQGASPIHFEKFSLTGLIDYQISDNRRSTNQILNLLNRVRNDIKQNPIRNVPGERPIILIGDMNWAFAEATGKVGATVTTLSRDNITSNAMKRNLSSVVPTNDLLVEFATRDSNTDRRRVMISCINSIELGKQKRFKEAIKEMERNFYSIQDKGQRKKVAFGKLAFLLSKYKDYKSKSLIELYNLVKINLRTDIAKFSKGGIQDFYNNHTYEQLAVSVKISDDNSPNRTIHKAKGDEFDNVLVILKNQSDLNFILKPNLSAEEHRVFYVAVSRSREQLFISVPSLDVSAETQLAPYFDFIREPISVNPNVTNGASN